MHGSSDQIAFISQCSKIAARTGGCLTKEGSMSRGDFQSRGTTLCDTVIANTRHYIIV